MTGAVIALAVTLVGVAGGLIYFARAALSRSDKLYVVAETSSTVIDQLEKGLAEAEAKRVAADTQVKRLEALNADTTDDPLLEKWFAASLNLLNPASRRIIVDGLATDRRVHAHSDGDSDDPDRGPVPVPDVAGTPIATELL